MSLALVMLALFFLLGISFGPLLVAVLTQAFSAERSHGIARWAIGLGLASVYKPALTFNNSSELTLKRRSFDEKHDAEYINFGGMFGGVKRYLLDRDDRYHSFYNVPFAFVDERFGVPVDPRDVDVGSSMRKDQKNSRYEHRVATDGGWSESVKAVFERPVGHIGVRLSEASTMYGGSIDAKVLERIREFYQSGQAPKNNTTALKQLLVPIGAFIAVVLMGFFIAGQGAASSAAPSGGSTNGTTINTGLLLFTASVSNWRAWNWRDIMVGGVLASIAAVIVLGLVVIFSGPVSLIGMTLPLGAWAVVCLLLGLAAPPFVAQWFGRSLGPLGMALGKLYLIIGLLSFRRPVIDYDDGEYRVVEYDAEEWPVEPHWYRFAFNRVGVSFNNEEENWPDGTTLSPVKVEEMAKGDGPGKSPSGYETTDLIKVGDIHGFVPEDVDDEATYVRTDRTTGWLGEAGKDRRLLQIALETAKQDFGGGEKPVDDKWIMAFTMASMAMGAVFNWLVFF